MKEIQIGSNIADLRRKKGMTQEELAVFLGVSKPAVSKWESGQSYPDITLLPVLASFFNIAVDELLGYQPQMAKDDVKKWYARMSAAFARQPFEQVHVVCREYAKKYYSCWLLQIHVGLLLVNHANLAGPPEKMLEILTEAEEIFARVVRESDDLRLARQGVSLQAYCCLAAGRPAEVIDLLADLTEVPSSYELLLAKAYQMKGDTKKAESTLQAFVYHGASSVLGACADLMANNRENPEKAKRWMNTILEAGRLFGLDVLQTAQYLSIYLTAAQLSLSWSDREGALEMLERYAGITEDPHLFPITLRGSELFDSLDDFFAGLDLGTQPPRSEAVIRQSIWECVAVNPAFEPLKQDPRFELVLKKLEKSKTQPPQKAD